MIKAPLIFLVEDDPFTLKIYSSKLQKEGFEVIKATNGEECIHHLQASKTLPDLIILDLVLPKKNGFEVLAYIRSYPKFKNLKVIVLSNLGQKEDIERARKLGIEDYLVKTEISVYDLVDKVKKYLNL